MKKMEFSKKWLIGCVAISLIYTTLSYILAFMGLETVEALSIEVLQTLWGTSAVSFVFYCGQNSVRAYTGSRWGLPNEKQEPVEEICDNRRGD